MTIFWPVAGFGFRNYLENLHCAFSNSSWSNHCSHQSPFHVWLETPCPVRFLLGDTPSTASAQDKHYSLAVFFHFRVPIHFLPTSGIQVWWQFCLVSSPWLLRFYQQCWQSVWCGCPSGFWHVFPIGTIHLRRWQIITNFWPLPPYRRQFFSTIHWQIFDPSLPKTCRRLKWMVP